MSTTIQAADLARYVIGRSSADGPVAAFWVAVATPRDQYARELLDAAAGYPIVPLVVRGNGFRDPNCVLQDLASLIASSEAVFRADATKAAVMAHSCLSIVLLAKTELAVPQAASPIRLPDWFPTSAGDTVSVYIRDVTTRVTLPLSSPQFRLRDLCEALFDLEGACLRRLRQSQQADHRHCSALWDRLKDDGDRQTFAAFLDGADAYRVTVRNADSYRPSTRVGKSLLAKLWQRVGRTTPEEMPRLGRALAAALQLGSDEVSRTYEPLLSILGRASAAEPAGADRWARNLLSTVAFSCQLITIAAHADDYPEYPAPMARGVTEDLLRAVEECTEVLDAAINKPAAQPPP